MTPEYKVQIRDSRMRVVALSEGLEALLGWSMNRPIERIDIWPGRGTHMCQCGFAWDDGSTCIFDEEEAPLREWLAQARTARQWPAPTVHARRAS